MIARLLREGSRRRTSAFAAALSKERLHVAGVYCAASRSHSEAFELVAS
jgi:hypothetical protein